MLRSQKAGGGNCKEVDKSSERFGSFPGLGRQKLRFEFAKAVCVRENKIPERREGGDVGLKPGLFSFDAFASVKLCLALRLPQIHFIATEASFLY